MDLRGARLCLWHLLRDDSGQMAVIGVVTRVHENQHVLSTIFRSVGEVRVSVQVDRARLAVVGSGLPTAHGLAQIDRCRERFSVSFQHDVHLYHAIKS